MTSAVFNSGSGRDSTRLATARANYVKAEARFDALTHSRINSVLDQLDRAGQRYGERAANGGLCNKVIGYSGQLLANGTLLCLGIAVLPIALRHGARIEAAHQNLLTATAEASQPR
jgi:hypothetical protein